MRKPANTIKALIFSIAALLAMPMGAVAEPGPIIDYLMKGEVSRFSFGLYRLDQQIKDIVQNRAINLFHQLEKDLEPSDADGWYHYNDKRVLRHDERGLIIYPSNSIINSKHFAYETLIHYGRAYYDWDKNRIAIEIVIHRPIFDPNSVKSVCKDNLSAFRSFAGWNTESAQWDNSKRKYSNFALNFSDIGFSRETDAKDLYEKLDSITEISIEINPWSPFSDYYKERIKDFYPSIKCTGPLASNEVFYSE